MSESAVDSSVDGPIFTVWTTVALLTEGAKSCEFCYTIWLGLQQYRFFWECKWNRLNYLYALQDHVDDYTEEQYYLLANKNKHGFEPVADRLVDERRVFLSLNLYAESWILGGTAFDRARGNSTYDRNEILIALDYFTLEGETHSETGLRRSLLPPVDQRVLNRRILSEVVGSIGGDLGQITVVELEAAGFDDGDGMLFSQATRDGQPYYTTTNNYVIVWSRNINLTEMRTQKSLGQ